METQKPKGNTSNSLKYRRLNPRDEFYTLYDTIHNEVLTYPLNVWEGKNVYCPCDSEESNFFKFFLQNFQHLKLKSLTCSSIQGRYCKITNPLKAVKWVEMEDDVFYNKGDFRSLQAKQIMQECNIVVTNPPFSLSTSFLEQICRYNKEYLIIAHQANLNCKSVFKEIMRGNLRAGNTANKEGVMLFRINDAYEDIQCTEIEEGRLARVISVWITNLPTKEKKLPVNDVEDVESYIAGFKRFEKYPQVVNFKFMRDVPTNYNGVMGVPLTYLKYHNPKDYIIHGRNGFEGGGTAGLKLQGEEKAQFGRIFIQKIQKSD